MTCSISRFTTSPPFQFVVGPEKKVFYLHASLVASLSKALQALVNGHMIEATNQKVEWPDTDEATFARFAQYAYTGKYDGVEKIKQEIVQKQLEDETRRWGRLWGTSKKKKKLQDMKFFRDVVVSYPYAAAVQRMFENRCPDFQCCHDGVSWCESKDPAMYMEMLMAHAQVYVFADYHGIDKLQSLALRQMHRLLVQFPVTYETVGSILELVQYTYENTRPNKNESLRCMVSAYGACTLYHFLCDKNVETLMKSLPEFEKDLFSMVVGCEV